MTDIFNNTDPQVLPEHAELVTVYLETAKQVAALNAEFELVKQQLRRVAAAHIDSERKSCILDGPDGRQVRITHNPRMSTLEPKKSTDKGKLNALRMILGENLFNELLTHTYKMSVKPGKVDKLRQSIIDAGLLPQVKDCFDSKEIYSPKKEFLTTAPPEALEIVKAADVVVEHAVK